MSVAERQSLEEYRILFKREYFDVGFDVPKHIRETFFLALYEITDCFVFTEERIDKIRDFRYKEITKSHIPYFSRSYVIPLALKDFVDEHLNLLLKRDIVEPCDSSDNIPIILLFQRMFPTRVFRT